MSKGLFPVSTKRQVLLWTDQWFPFCAAATVSWRQWVLLLADKNGPEQGGVVFLVAAIACALAVPAVTHAVARRRPSEALPLSLFNDPNVVVGVMACMLAGWAVEAAYALGLAVPWWLGMVGSALTGAACTGLFVAWAEVFVFVGMSQATFTLAGCLALAGVMDMVSMYSTGVAFAVTGLLLVAATGAGIRRAGVMLLDPSEADEGEQRQEPAHAASTWMVSISLIVMLTCLTAIKTVGTGLPMAQCSIGVSLAGLLVVLMLLAFGRVPLNWLWRISLPVLVCAAVAAAMPGLAHGWASRVLSDMSVAMLCVMGASIGVDYARRHATPVIDLACTAVVAMSSADLAGSYGTLALLEAGVSGTAVVVGCAIVATVAVMVCLVWNDQMELVANTFTGVSAFSDDRGLSYLRPTDDAAERVTEQEHTLLHPARHDDDKAEGGQGGGAVVGEAPAGGVLVSYPNAPFCPLPSNVENARRLARAAALAYGLREREEEVLVKLLMGESAGQAAVDLFIARGTVKAHIHNIYSKAGVHNREDLKAAVDRAFTKEQGQNPL